MKKTKIAAIWIVALLITVAFAVFQRMTGPTHPYKQKIELAGTTYSIKLLRSADTGNNLKMTLPISDTNVSGTVRHRLYPSADDYTADSLRHTSEGLVFELPEQPAAGKVEYSIVLSDGNSSYESPTLVVRFKDPVPAVWLIIHVVTMFLAMFLAVVAGLYALLNKEAYPKIFLWSGILLFIGGMILGPVVQKYAFGEYWTGVPFGWDLTDNKTLLVMIVFIATMIRNYKKASRALTIAAVAVLLLIYLVPHSMFGSELDRSSGKIVQSK